MARGMPSLGSTLASQVVAAAEIARGAELARNSLPPGSDARAGLRASRLEAIYEMAYLRVFVACEVFLEESFVRMMCGWSSPIWTPVLNQGNTFRTIAAARNALPQ